MGVGWEVGGWGGFGEGGALEGEEICLGCGFVVVMGADRGDSELGSFVVSVYCVLDPYYLVIG